MKKYIKPNIEVVAGCSMQTFAMDNTYNPNPPLEKGTDNWEPEDDSDGW
ncbi:MAG: hypothetical protein LUC49_03990 [Prevotella sp.]|nr:hypothetical protein [Prevotella sp.]